MVKCGVFFAVRTELLNIFLYALQLQRVNWHWISDNTARYDVNTLFAGDQKRCSNSNFMHFAPQGCQLTVKTARRDQVGMYSKSCGESIQCCVSSGGVIRPQRIHVACRARKGLVPRDCPSAIPRLQCSNLTINLTCYDPFDGCSISVTLKDLNWLPFCLDLNIALVSGFRNVFVWSYCVMMKH
jgi:hypothetical protein